jgi:hypothetical protein
MLAATQTVRLNATKILRAKLKIAKMRVDLTKKLAVVLSLILNASNQLVRRSAEKILFAKKVPSAEVYVHSESGH